MSNIQAGLEGALRGSHRGFSELVKAYRDLAMALARRRLKNEALAEEAVQEAFFTAYLNLDKLKDQAAFSAWLRTILDRHCLRIQRKESLTANLKDTQTIPDPGGLDPFEIYTRYLDQARVRKILRGFSGSLREACILRYIHGRPYKEIARVLDIPVGTVKRRLHTARDRMLCKLRHQGQQPSIRIGYLPISDHLLAMVAHQHHNPQDYSMLLRRFLSWDSLVRCLKDASLDVAFIMAPLAMSLRNQHLDIKYLLDGHHDGQALTVSSVLNSCPAFGTKMALPYSISTHRLFMNLLFGLDSRTKQDLDNSTLFISPSYVLNSLRKHEIDAFFCSEPWNTKSAFQGTGRIIARSKDLAPGHICCILVGRTQFANSNPELLNRYVHDLLQAGKYITTHPQQGAAIQSCYTGIDLDIAKHILTNRHITFEDLTPEPSRVESIMGLALEAGLLDKPCDLQNFIQPPKS